MNQHLCDSKILYRLIFGLLLTLMPLMAKESKEITLQLKWKYQFQFAGFIMAKEKGFFRDFGLDVRLREFDTQTAIIEDVLVQRAHFGISDSALIYDKIQGKNVTALMSIFQDTPFILLGLKHRGIQTLQDLNGKTLALYEGLDGVGIQAMLKANNIHYRSSPPIFTVDELQKGGVDMMTAYLSNEPYIAQTKGLDTLYFRPKDYGFEGYGDILFCSQELLKKDPKLVQDFYLASYQGWQYAFSHVEETIMIIHDRYNTLNKSLDALRYEARMLIGLSGFHQGEFGKLDLAKVKGIASQFNLIKNDSKSLASLEDFIYKIDPKKIALLKDPTLSLEQKQYLLEKGTLKMCSDPNWMPFEKTENGKYIGLMSEYIELLEQKIHTPIEQVVTKTWGEALENVYQRECDFLSLASKTEKRERFLDFTQPVIEAPLVIATKNNTIFLNHINEHLGKLFCAVRGYAVIPKLKDKYPNIHILEVDSVHEGLEYVARGTVFGFIGNSLSVMYELDKNFLGSLAITGKLDESLSYSIASRNDEPLLVTIFEGKIAQIDPHTKEHIISRWVNFDKKKLIDFEFTWKIVAIFVVIFLVLLIGVLFLRHNKRRLERQVTLEIEKNKQHQALMLQQSKLAQMGEMISMIAHQWRQPLNNLSMLNQSIKIKYKRDSLDAKTMDYFFENSSKQIAQMSQTIDDFRGFFKPDKEKVEFCIHDVISNCLNIIGPILHQKNIQIDVVDDLTLMLVGYPNELGQVILNLVHNAIDAFEDKKKNDKMIQIYLKRSDDTTIVMIRDNAGGIPHDILPNIFDPYFSTKENKNGTGLGLYMSKLIIEDHMSGKITVENSRDGALFYLSFSNEARVGN